MPKPHIELLSTSDLEAIHQTSLGILNDVGVTIHHEAVLRRLSDAGAKIDFTFKRARLEPERVESAIRQAGKQYILYGRDPQQIARFGYGDLNLIASPGQFAWFDVSTGERRSPNLVDVCQAARVGDALSNITIVGAMGVPVDVPTPFRDVVQTAELIKGTTKPTRCWPVTRRSAHYVLEMYAAVAGGKQQLLERPMVEVFLEPISPLQLPETGLDIMLEFLEYGQPVSIGPMSMACGTGPATLAGTLAQENAEILAGITVIQTLRPGTPVLYGGIPHIMDPRTSICAFGSPEQGLMAAAMSQMGKFYGFPTYINVNLTDAKTLDIQAGLEKMGSFILGAISGADLFGHAGLLGTDHGASLLWLVIDDEIMEYVRRILRGFDLNVETLAYLVIADIGPGGNYLTHNHTLAHFRKELWAPRPIWTRETYENWVSKGSRSMGDRALDRLHQILDRYEPFQIDPQLSQELDRIVEAAGHELED
jgi:trimethylamine--corrinoid protein Co-methyltransferase